jgi:DNA-damage-inducible protein D
MDKDIEKAAKSLFDSIKHVDEKGDDYWLGRELGEALGYANWDRFEKVITRAKVSITESGQDVENHFHHVVKMVSIGYGNERSINDIRLTRYACYIIAQNGNAAKKPNIALAQAYFAYQTRKQELAEQRRNDIERLVARHKFTESDRNVTDMILEKEMSPTGLARIKSSGDKAMFGGKGSKQIKKQYGITNQNSSWANRAPNVVLAAKSLANEMTTAKLASLPIDTFEDIKNENDENNVEVRKALGERGIVPEDLPPAEDTDKVLKRVQETSKLIPPEK